MELQVHSWATIMSLVKNASTKDQLTDLVLWPALSAKSMISFFP